MKDILFVISDILRQYKIAAAERLSLEQETLSEVSWLLTLDKFRDKDAISDSISRLRELERKRLRNGDRRSYIISQTELVPKRYRKALLSRIMELS